eukprot:3974945-Amphidinium_carterae.1
MGKNTKLSSAARRAHAPEQAATGALLRAPRATASAQSVRLPSVHHRRTRAASQYSLSRASPEVTCPTCLSAHTVS